MIYQGLQIRCSLFNNYADDISVLISGESLSAVSQIVNTEIKLMNGYRTTYLL